MRRLSITLALVFAASSANAQFLPRGFDDDVHTITEGSQFGITIGMDRLSARKGLQKHWNIRYNSTSPCHEGPYEEQNCFGAQDIDYYDVTGDILGGDIDLFIKDDHVVAITWWRHPLDF